MAMGPERSRPLHNFTLPCELKWGNQKFLRCVKLDSNGEIAAVHRRPNERRRVVQRAGSNDRLREMKKFSPPPAVDGEDGIASVREKLMFDLQTAADKMKDAIFREGLKDESPATAETAAVAVVVEEEVEGGQSPAAAVATEPDQNKPWSLRTRRAACKGPNGFPVENGGSREAFKVDVIIRPNNNNISPLSLENKSPILRTGFATAATAATATAGASPSGEKRERAKFSVPLARREIEEDFMAIVGHRPARRPKKRAKLVQKNMDTLFPGLWLTEITADLYKVPDDQ